MESRARGTGSVAAMILGVLAVYAPLALLDGRHTLIGIDYTQFHARRIHYAQEALRGGGGLPAWFSRELFGTPFWSNVQSFPFLPTRLALLPIEASLLYPVAVNLAAVLAALFTYLYLRRLGLRPIAAAAAGWTFAASGFFAARVLAGHLSFLEAFAALPLLLWILEGIARSEPGERRHGLAHLFLALATLAVALSGHPQLPAYAIGTAILYALARIPGRPALRALASIGLGVAAAAFAWWPMLRLIGRSTRVLDLDPPENDLAFPAARLRGFLFPWADGWPAPVARFPARAFAGAPDSTFWDTAAYVGWIPWIASAWLLARAIRERRAPARPWLFLAVAGALALVTALPWVRALAPETSWTLLRSPARQVYVTTFALAAGLGALVDRLLAGASAARRAPALAGALLLVAVHAADLAVHDAPFVRSVERPPDPRARVAAWRADLGPQRAAIDLVLEDPARADVDDAGFFDSILLARPYRAFLALAGLPPRTNTEHLDGSRLPARALAGLGVRRVLAKERRTDLERVTSGGAESYLVREAAPRAAFVADVDVEYLEDADVLAGFRGGLFDPGTSMHLPPSVRPPPPTAEGMPIPAPATVRYERPAPDRIEVRVDTDSSGYLRVLEAFDEGWSVEVDGAPRDVVVADTFLMAVRLAPGSHAVRLEYRTPGARAGLIASGIAAALLALWGARLGGARYRVRAARL